jgi:fructose-bisphosphate aldolase, class II
MITWGVKVNDYGNAILDQNGEFAKMEEQGVSSELWDDMVAYAREKGLKKGNYKKLNLPFETRLLSEPREIRERMAKGVAEFVYGMLTRVFNAEETAPLAIEAILEAGSFDLGPKSERIEDPSEWTEERIRERAGTMDVNKGPAGDFED